MSRILLKDNKVINLDNKAYTREYCCQQRTANKSAPGFSDWYVYGSTTVNLPNCELYADLVFTGEGDQTVSIKNKNGVILANGTHPPGGGVIILNERLNSGISGSVTWNGTNLTQTDIALLCV